jgi:hypothetical protein
MNHIAFAALIDVAGLTARLFEQDCIYLSIASIPELIRAN